MNITRILFFGLAIFFTVNFNAQNTVNDYKYVIVPEGYVFLRENDDYQLNSLTKFLFEKCGFTAFIRGEALPEDLKRNGCKGLRADVRKKSGLLKTKLTIDLIDCNGAVVFTSREGASREKEFKKSYQEALRNAFRDVKSLNYKYNGKKETSAQNDNSTVQQPAVSKQTVVSGETPVATASDAQITNNQKNNLPKQNVSVAKSGSYMYNDEVYVFERRAYGFELLQNADTKVPIGKIFISSRDNSYIIQAGDLSGNGYFDAYGNFILDRINPVTDKLITDTFARQ
ncbi:hypothetical protein [uncultured Aquimarina sp.]|uniref:hypothetical protein n=1 Tax=uncultured Aquimarina sp. TaxID=575652 RepID=UPI002637EF73|nr:hypothetical protein [uncultured Aquimarina sp.]